MCAVEVAVRILEDDPVFDAGHGSFLNKAGEVEMDAIITDGCEWILANGGRERGKEGHFSH